MCTTETYLGERCERGVATGAIPLRSPMADAISSSLSDNQPTSRSSPCGASTAGDQPMQLAREAGVRHIAAGGELPQPVEVALGAGSRGAVESDHPVAARREGCGGVAADEAGASGDDPVHEA